MESQLMRSKTLLAKEKELKWKQMKTQTSSRRTVSFSSTVASSSSSSCPDYCQTEVFVNIDDGDQLGIDIPAASSEVLSVFQKSEVSKVMLAFLVTVIMALFIYLKSYSDDKSEIPQWFVVFVVCILFFGATLIIIGIVLREMIPLIARVLEVAGFLIILPGVFGFGSSIMPMVLIWVAWLCYIIITIVLLLDLFPKLTARILPTLLAWSGFSPTAISAPYDWHIRSINIIQAS